MINKQTVGKDKLFSTFSLDASDIAERELTTLGSFKLWFHFMKNQNEYVFPLYSSTVREALKISRSAFDDGIKTLIEKRYLVLREGTKNTYDFYDVPLEYQNGRTEESKDAVAWKTSNPLHEKQATDAWKTSNPCMKNKQVYNTDNINNNISILQTDDESSEKKDKEYESLSDDEKLLYDFCLWQIVHNPYKDFGKSGYPIPVFKKQLKELLSYGYSTRRITGALVIFSSKNKFGGLKPLLPYMKVYEVEEERFKSILERNEGLSEKLQVHSLTDNIFRSDKTWKSFSDDNQRYKKRQTAIQEKEDERTKLSLARQEEEPTEEEKPLTFNIPVDEIKW